MRPLIHLLAAAKAEELKMAFTVELHRSPDNATWTLITQWTTGAELLVDFVADSPGVGTWFYRLQVISNYTGDIAGPRRLAIIAGNR